MKSRLENHKIIVYVTAILTFIRIGLMLSLPYSAVGNSYYDDMHLLRVAAQILQGNWMGAYTNNTLIKGVSFPLFVALAKVMCIPYSLLLVLFYIVSAAIFCYAIKNLVKNKKVLALIYIFLIYSPASFADCIVQRLYRNAIVFPAVLLVIAALIGFFFAKDKKVLSQVKWLILSGVAFSFFYYIREDSIWFLPFFIVAPVIVLIWILFFSQFDKKTKGIRAMLLLIPGVIFVLSTSLYSGLNYVKYGVWTTNDRTDTEYAELVANMLSIEYIGEESRQYWISRDTVVTIIDNSPTLLADKDVIMERYDAWAGEEEHIKGDLFTWSLREAFAQLGYYSSASNINAHCKQINDEIQQAIEEGRLKTSNKIHFSSQAKGVELDEMPQFLLGSLKGLWENGTYKYAQTGVSYHVDGTQEEIRYMEAMTGVLAMYPTTQNLQASGWIFLKDNEAEIKVSVVDESGVCLINELELLDSGDVAVAFPDYANAGKARFTFKLNDVSDPQSLKFVIYSNGEVIGTYPIQSVEEELYLCNMDQYELRNIDDANNRINEYICVINSIIIKIGRILSYLILPVSLIVYLINVLCYFKRRTWKDFEICIIQSGLLLSAFILQLGVTIFTDWMDSTNAGWFYAIGTVPLLQVFEVLSLLSILNWLRKRATDHQEGIKEISPEMN